MPRVKDLTTPQILPFFSLAWPRFAAGLANPWSKRVPTGWPVPKSPVSHTAKPMRAIPPRPSFGGGAVLANDDRSHPAGRCQDALTAQAAPDPPDGLPPGGRETSEIERGMDVLESHDAFCPKVAPHAICGPGRVWTRGHLNGGGRGFLGACGNYIAV